MKIKHKSLKSRPGAGKRKERLVAMEMERFASNMAVMAKGGSRGTAGNIEGMNGDVDGGGGGDGDGVGSAARWAAIRGFIGQTMERRGEGEVGAGSRKGR